MVCIWCVFGVYLVCIWFVYCVYMVCIWCIFGQIKPNKKRGNNKQMKEEKTGMDNIQTLGERLAEKSHGV